MLSSLRITYVAAVAACVGLTACGREKPAPASEANVEASQKHSALAPGAVLGRVPKPCGDGGLVLMDVVAVTGSHDLRASPTASALKIKNEKASRILGQILFHQIDNSTTVRRLCAQADWTRVKIVTPDWLNHVEGWVPNGALRQIERTADNARVYVEEDFHWDDDTSRFKPEIVATVNQLMRENRNCDQVDTHSVAKSPSRSKPGDPVFFITCGTGANAFNVWFRPTDVQAGRSLVAKEPLGRNAAVDACEVAAKQAATHPSTVEFSRIRDLAYVPHVSGRAHVFSTFSAKNAFNLKLKYRIGCLFDGTTLVETSIAESLD